MGAVGPARIAAARALRARVQPPTLLLAALLLLAAALLAPPARAGSTARILALLNRERILNSLPAGILANPTWTAGCEAHDAYERRHGGLSHEEQKGSAGYSAEGDLIAATSVLAQGIYWEHGDPYDNAPFHLFDLLNPRISSVGAADSEGFGCVEIELGTLRPSPAAPLAYSYPGDRRTGVALSQRAEEQPATPAQTLGLGTRATGPNLFVYFDGPWSNGSRLHLEAATLSSAHGSIPLRFLDNTTSDLLAPTGAILVPVSPLRADTRYRAEVRGSVSGVVPGTTLEDALAGCLPSGAGASCGQPPATACFEDFATQAGVCGLERSWAVSDDFTFTTRRRG